MTHILSPRRRRPWCSALAALLLAWSARGFALPMTACDGTQQDVLLVQAEATALLGEPALSRSETRSDRLAREHVTLRTGGTWGPADPAPPHVVKDGERLVFELGDGTRFTPAPGDVLIFGTHNRFLHYPSVAHFEANVGGRVLPLRLHGADGAVLTHPEAVWDPMVHALSFAGEASPTVVMYGGVMETPPGTPATDMSHNIRRRVGAFVLKDGQWTFKGYVTGQPDGTSWVGHSYGHHVRVDPSGKITLHYEMVAEERTIDGKKVPWKTALYEVEMADAFTAKGEPRLIFDPAPSGGMPYRAAERRERGTGALVGYLAEGQRPHRLAKEGVILNAFSVANFSDMSYGSGLLVGKQVGDHVEWRPLLDASGDLKIITRGLQERLDVNWCGRLTFYETSAGELRAMLHGIPDGRSITASWSSPEVHRDILDVPVTPKFDAAGELVDVVL